MTTTNLEYLNPESACPAQGLYSHMTRVKAGEMYYVAGQLAVGADGGVVGEGDFDAQFRQVFKNLSDVLAAVGCDFNDIAKFTTYLVSADDIPHFMRLRAEYFPTKFRTKAFAPNTLLIINRLVKPEFRLEVEAIVRARD
ncbi:putative translation initiation inhibitor, yjgF family [Paraburkholderia piptadeniae]|uniref:Translation initiation inhibitor, yjgF family n=1 Tax=Paraburkholderia piptadeniae TaxID=1701573 RepID=A0A1N7S0A7_9BURK|nr:RidA family protein [Paraburkholderia piptadeniae]SIT40743.1 putative translation initiation inhibitor, yjgF family [Paraburkholderia piptadeniae]